MNYSDMQKLYSTKAKSYTVAQAKNAVYDIDATLLLHRDNADYSAKLWCERDEMIARIYSPMKPADICEYYDSHPNITLKQLSMTTGKTISYLKGLLLS